MLLKPKRADQDFVLEATSPIMFQFVSRLSQKAALMKVSCMHYTSLLTTGVSTGGCCKYQLRSTLIYETAKIKV